MDGNLLRKEIFVREEMVMQFILRFNLTFWRNCGAKFSFWQVEVLISTGIGALIGEKRRRSLLPINFILLEYYFA